MSASASTSAPASSKRLRDCDCVGGRFLAPALDAVCRGVVQQGGVMPTSRSLTNEGRMFAQHRLQGGEIAGHDGVDGGFEAGYRTRLRHRGDERVQVRPGVERLLLRDDEPGIVQVEPLGLDLVNGLAAEARVLPLDAPLRVGIASRQRSKQRLRLPLKVSDVSTRRRVVIHGSQRAIARPSRRPSQAPAPAPASAKTIAMAESNRL